MFKFINGFAVCWIATTTSWSRNDRLGKICLDLSLRAFAESEAIQ
ncbi:MULTISPECIES: hypothetical protein [unclassified Campylobacter]|nr:MULTISPECIES: hypothetical protein [unclassified Campylobacter]MDA3054001.1 hypothetical protein [Campylobacter sp. VBCF_07 NA4]MDA3060112.1 hypothetical protein [Campylobacter sp. VBCF_02 NA5]MDA3069626.1 hypothetical protein [Campylobacter sp. VBCF_08 NA3]